MVPGGARWRYVSGDDDVRRTSRYVDAGAAERGFNFRGDRNAVGVCSSATTPRGRVLRRRRAWTGAWRDVLRHPLDVVVVDRGVVLRSSSATLADTDAVFADCRVTVSAASSCRKIALSR